MLDCRKYRRLNFKIEMLVWLLAIKFLYIIAIDLFLPGKWLLWSYDKSVCCFYLPFELLFFGVCVGIYLYSYKRSSTYSVLTTFLFIMFYIPANSGLVLSNNDLWYYFMINMYAIILFITLGLLISKEENKIINNINNNKTLLRNKHQIHIIRSMTVLICVTILIFVYQYNGLCFSFHNDMYVVRATYAKYIERISGSFTSYLLLVFTKINQYFLPICLYFAVSRKKIIDTLLCLFAYFALFTVSMEKSTLLIIPCVCFFCWAEKYTDFSKICELIIRCFVGLFLIIFMEYMLFSTQHLFNLLCGRLLYMPTYMIRLHYNFFNVHSKLWLTRDVFVLQNIFRKLGWTLYDIERTGIISEKVFSGLIPSPNAGAFAEAFAQIGILGIVVFPLLIASIAKVLGKICVWYGKAVSAIIMFIFSRQIMSVSLLESFSFVGFIIFWVVSCVLKNYTKSRCKYLKNDCNQRTIK